MFFPEVELDALCEKSALMNRLFKKVFSNTGINVVDDFEKLRVQELDAVYVTTPNLIALFHNKGSAL